MAVYFPSNANPTAAPVRIHHATDEPLLLARQNANRAADQKNACTDSWSIITPASAKSGTTLSAIAPARAARRPAISSIRR